jgi:ribosomal protein S18 acetylase RimI-like enzyme
MYECTIRPAKPADAAEIANVHLNSWREAYKGLLPEDFLDKLPLTFKRRLNMWTQVIEEGKEVILVAEGKPGIVGFASFGTARDLIFQDFAELNAIYLLKHFKSKGIGYSLLKNGLEAQKNKGFEKAYCWVLENNPTIKFYERTGAIYGDRIKTDEIGGQAVKELAYVWNNIKD